MHMSRAAAPGADRERAAEPRLAARCKRSDLFMPHADPLDSVMRANRISDAVERIADYAEHTFNAGAHQRLDQHFRYVCCHFILRFDSVQPRRSARA